MNNTNRPPRRVSPSLLEVAASSGTPSQSLANRLFSGGGYGGSRGAVTSSKFSFFQKYLSHWLNFNIVQATTLLILLSQARDGFDQVSHVLARIYEWIIRFFTASMVIGPDRLHGEVKSWLRAFVLTDEKMRFFQARADRSWDDDCSFHPGGRRRSGVYYVPVFSFTWFIHDRNFFIVKSESSRRAEFLTVMCLGRSVEPVRRFLQTCRNFCKRESERYVQLRLRSGHNDWPGCFWDTTLSRPARPLDSVHFDLKTKEQLLRDITTYLNPETRRDYRARGIPYRRGYLFHGPPGTGKTTLTLALAGYFNLELYFLNLQTVQHDKTLLELFGSLPPRCIVLIEDVDAVGLDKRELAKSHRKREPHHNWKRKKGIQEEPREFSGSATQSLPGRSEQNIPLTTKSDDEDDDDNNKDDDISTPDSLKLSSSLSSSSSYPCRHHYHRHPPHHRQHYHSRSPSPPGSPLTGVTLSGLLNALDGITSQEGRIAILTTNCPDKLDVALVRHGRIDMKVYLGYVNRQGAEEMFTRLCTPLGRHVKKVEQDTKRNGGGGGEEMKQSNKREKWAGAGAGVSSWFGFRRGKEMGARRRLKETWEGNNRGRGRGRRRIRDGLRSEVDSPGEESSEGTDGDSDYDEGAGWESIRIGDEEEEISDCDTKQREEKNDDDEATWAALAKEFASRVPEDKVTPAQLQGYLLEHRGNPKGAVEQLKDWLEKEVLDSSEKRTREYERRDRRGRGAGKKDRVSKEKRLDEERGKNEKQETRRRRERTRERLGKHKAVAWRDRTEMMVPPHHARPSRYYTPETGMSRSDGAEDEKRTEIREYKDDVQEEEKKKGMKETNTDENNVCEMGGKEGSHSVQTEERKANERHDTFQEGGEEGEGEDEGFQTPRTTIEEGVD